MRSLFWAETTYTYFLLRQVPANAPAFTTMVSQIKTGLNHFGMLMISSYKSPVLLLWVSAIGGLAAIGRPERSWFIELLAGGFFVLAIWTLDDLMVILMRVTWLDGIYQRSLVGLLTEVEEQLQL